MKRLLNDLFGVRVQDGRNPINAQARRLVTDELHRLGWATKVNAGNEPVDTCPESRSQRYLLHRLLRRMRDERRQCRRVTSEAWASPIW
jgi:hypothetical protein